MVNDSTIAVDMWEAVRTLCVSAVSDAGLSAGVEPVFSAKVNSKPMVIIPPPSTPKLMNKFGSNAGRYDMTVTIYCYAKNTKALSELKQAIINGLETYPISGVSLSGYEDDYTFTEINDATYHLITISASYNRE